MQPGSLRRHQTVTTTTKHYHHHHQHTNTNPTTPITIDTMNLVS